jgi:hypothetical protein
MANGKTPVDTENHRITSIRGAGENGRGHKAGETTIWKLGDVRMAAFRIYRGGEALDWAITDLVKRTNSAIESKRMPGKSLSIGDIVQSCVYAYYFESDQRVRKPRTTEDSPAYASLPYEICLAPEGFWIVKPALPKEALIHFKIPVYVGEIVRADETGKQLTEEQRQALYVTLQLKEAQRIVNDADFENRERIALEKPKYILGGEIDKQASDYFSGLKEDCDEQEKPEEKPAEKPEEILGKLKQALSKQDLSAFRFR